MVRLCLSSKLQTNEHFFSKLQAEVVLHPSINALVLQQLAQTISAMANCLLFSPNDERRLLISQLVQESQ
jgi:hypothetical protein